MEGVQHHKSYQKPRSSYLIKGYAHVGYLRCVCMHTTKYVPHLINLKCPKTTHFFSNDGWITYLFILCNQRLLSN